MLISCSISIVLVGLVSIDLISGGSVNRDRPTRDVGNNPRMARSAFQVLNQPKGRRPDNAKSKRSQSEYPPGNPGAQPSPSLPIDPASPPPNAKLISASSPKDNSSDRTPLLDFPAWQIEDEGGPLLDFPDPLEADFKQRSLSFDGSCRTNHSITLKEKAMKSIIKKHKPHIIHEVKTQNRILQQAMMYHFIEAVQIPDHQPMNGWKILEQSAAIFQSFCKGNKHLPASFIPNAIYAFKKLHYLTTPERTEYLSDVNYKWISATLYECSNRSRGFHFFQDQCHQDIVAWKKEHNWLCTRWSDDFNLGVYDPLLDIIWHIYNGVYFYCRDYFHQSYWQLHTYAAAMMDLYTNAIKLRWNHQIQSEEFWTRILGPNFQAHARNIEKCTQATVESQEMQVMMPRYISSASVRYSLAENTL